jgi:hydrogenase nickel incorporation protein HypB
MCTTCGCGAGETKIEDAPVAHEHEHRHADGTVHRHDDGEHGHDHAHEHWHRHADGTWHSHGHEHHGAHNHGHASDLHEHPRGQERLDYGAGPAGAHAPGMSQARMVQIEQDILAKNDAYAAQNRRWFDDHGVFALNLVSSPGSGKTTLLVRTIDALKDKLPLAVIEGDQQTSVDAERIRATGARAIQINTGKGCHLDAHMVGHALERLPVADDGVLMIENVGNLVCPAAFDLGEAHKVVILSVTEGEDKPLKYPDMFRAASLMLLNKSDLLPHLSFDVDRAIGYARRINPGLRVIRTSSVNGEGLDDWLAWIDAGVAAQRDRRQANVEALRARVAELEAQLAVLKR